MTALGAAVFSYFLFLLLYPLLLRLVMFLLSFVFSSKGTGESGERDFGPSPVAFGVVMFFG